MSVEGGPPLAGLSVVQKARAYQLLAEHERHLAAGKRLHHDDHRELHQLLAQAGGHIYEGRIPMNAAEHAAVDKVLARHGGTGTLTRRDPGNTGPVIAHTPEATYEISVNGRAKRVA